MRPIVFVIGVGLTAAGASAQTRPDGDALTFEIRPGASVLLKLKDLNRAFPPAPSVENVPQQREYIRELRQDNAFATKYPREYCSLLFSCYGGLCTTLSDSGIWDSKLAEQMHDAFRQCGEPLIHPEPLEEIAKAAKEKALYSEAAAWQRRYVAAEQRNRPGEALGWDELITLYKKANMPEEAKKASIEFARANYSQPSNTVSAALAVADMGEWELANRVFEVGQETFDRRLRELRAFSAGKKNSTRATDSRPVHSQNDDVQSADLESDLPEEFQELTLELERADLNSKEMQSLSVEWRIRLKQLRKQLSSHSTSNPD